MTSKYRVTLERPDGTTSHSSWLSTEQKARDVFCMVGRALMELNALGTIIAIEEWFVNSVYILQAMCLNADNISCIADWPIEGF